ncbi:MAG: hypothetical protein ACXW3G_09340, partial [Rhodoplanes sp.]
LGEPEYRSSAFQAGGFMRTAKFAGVLALAIVSASMLSAEVMRKAVGQQIAPGTQTRAAADPQFSNQNDCSLMVGTTDSEQLGFIIRPNPKELHTIQPRPAGCAITAAERTHASRNCARHGAARAGACRMQIRGARQNTNGARRFIVS